MIHRRRFLGVLGMTAMHAALAGHAYAQGVATRSVRPQPRGKPSGIPFDARFMDVAAEAGLTSPVIYGGTDRKDYILETNVSGERMAMFSLSKAGYGSLAEIEQWDTDQFLDAIEFEQITADIQAHKSRPA